MSPKVDYGPMMLVAYPDCKFHVYAHDFATLYWDPSNPVSKPTELEVMARFNSAQCDAARRLLRAERDKLLSDSDRYAMPDYPHPTPEARGAWLQYRQSLRDLPDITAPSLGGDCKLLMESVAWPEPPVQTGRTTEKN